MQTSTWLGSRLLGFLLLAPSLFAAAPVFQRSDAIAVTLGQDVDYRLVAIGDGIRYSAQGLPSGVTIDTSTGRISGTPSDVGTYRTTVNAANADGLSSATLTISVVSPDAAPLIYAPLIFDAYDQPHQGGDVFTCTLKATGAPTAYQTNDALPGGWTFTNGVLVGATTTPGLYLVNVSATNTYGTGSAAITVRVHPACTGLQQTTGALQAGDVFTVTLQFNRPVSFSGTTPYLEFHTYPDSGTKRLAYVSGNGTTSLVFSYTITAQDTAGDILVYPTLQPAANGAVEALTDADGLSAGSALPVYGAPTAAATIVTRSSASSVAPETTDAGTGTSSQPTAAAGQGTAATSTTTVAPPSGGAPATDTMAPTGSVNTGMTTAGTVASTPVSTTAAPSSTTSTTGADTTTNTANATGTAATTSDGARLANLSARAFVDAGDSSRAFIAGFVVTGNTPKHMLVRAVGPSLAPFGVLAPLANPLLRLVAADGHVVAESDDWSGDVAATSASVGAFALETGSKDAAVAVTLAPGAYSMQVLPNGGSGVALAELYDADSATSTPLINISSRGYVGTGENVLTAGFVVQGNSPKRLLIRGVGPALAAFGVSGVLADPSLRIYQGNAVVAQNDDWQVPQPGATPAEIAAAGKGAGAFDLANGSRDAATIVTLAPGNYSAVVSGANDTTGAGLVEVYELK